MNGPIADYLTKRGYNVERRNALSAKYGMALDGTLDNLADDACFIDWFGRTVLCVDDETYRRAFWREVFTTGHTIGPLPRTWRSAVRELSGCPFYSNGLDIWLALFVVMHPRHASVSGWPFHGHGQAPSGFRQGRAWDSPSDGFGLRGVHPTGDAAVPVREHSRRAFASG